MAEEAEEEQQLGKFVKNSGNFGFIEVLSPEDDQPSQMFVMPAACKAFGGRFPAIGTLVRFSVVTDQKTGRPRAEHVSAAGDAADIDGPGGEGSMDEDDSKLMQDVFDDVDAAFDDALSSSQPGEGGGGASSSEALGTMSRIRGSFGFILQDDGTDMFVMPIACKGFSKQLPEIGTRVRYTIVTDEKTGRPRAEDVHPAGGAGGGGPALSGGSSPSAPPRPFSCFGPRKSSGSGGSSGGGGKGCGSWAEHLAPDQSSGTMSRDLGKFGFIAQDDGGEDMFVMPVACQEFGGLPPIGTRVRYTVVIDSKTGRPRAETVQPLPGSGGGVRGGAGGGGRGRAPGAAAASKAAVDPESWEFARLLGEAASMAIGAESDGLEVGTMLRTSGSFGFIQMDDGSEMFVMPKACAAFDGHLPPIGARVTFAVVTDAKTGLPRADNVRPLLGGGGRGGGGGAKGGAGTRGAPGAAAAAAAAAALPHLSASDLVKILEVAAGGSVGGGGSGGRGGSTRQSGTLARTSGKFGFINQDDGVEMFVLPCSCQFWGKSFPPVGTRLTYDIVIDEKTGKPRADNIEPEGSGGWSSGGGGYGAAPRRGGGGRGARAEPYQRRSTGGGGSGGEAQGWEGWGDSGGGGGCRSWEAAAVTGVVCLGTVNRLKGKFGFIAQDSGKEDMFVMPGACAAFGGEIPPIGTRVRYSVVVDAKTGRPRAEDVQLGDL